MNINHSLMSVFALSLFSLNAFAKEPATDQRDKVYDYLKANVIGKTVSFSSVTPNSDKTVEYDFSRIIRYRNLVRSELGLTFDVFALIKQTNYDLKDGKRVQGKAGVNKDRELVVRYKFRQSESTGILIGSADVLASSLLDPIGNSMAVTLKLEGDSLVLREVTPLFADFFAAGDTYKPGRSENVGTFTTINGKLKLNEKYTSYYVNPDTLEKTGEGTEKVQINDELGSREEVTAAATEVDGTWKLTGYIEDGKANPDEVKADYQVTRKDGVQEITKGGKSFTTRKFEIGVQKSPKTIDFINEAGARTLAIYEINGDQMRVALLVDPVKQKSERPADFKEAGKIIATYERVK